MSVTARRPLGRRGGILGRPALHVAQLPQWERLAREWIVTTIKLGERSEHSSKVRP